MILSHIHHQSGKNRDLLSSSLHLQETPENWAARGESQHHSNSFFHLLDSITFFSVKKHLVGGVNLSEKIWVKFSQPSPNRCENKTIIWVATTKAHPIAPVFYNNGPSIYTHCMPTTPSVPGGWSSTTQSSTVWIHGIWSGFRLKKKRPFVKLLPYNGYMGVSKNRGTPKWMVYNGKPY